MAVVERDGLARSQVDELVDPGPGKLEKLRHVPNPIARGFTTLLHQKRLYKAVLLLLCDRALRQEGGDPMPETLQILILGVAVGLLSGLGHVSANLRSMRRVPR